ncbi:MAG: hypothetical protein IPI30_14945 [Saprospiraceae bacterium]|nr:hypothetical protein [Candidatus Vicinibacter affinis]
MSSVFKVVIIGSERKAAIFQHLLKDCDDFPGTQVFTTRMMRQMRDVFGNLLYTFELAGKSGCLHIDRHIRYLNANMIEHFIRDAQASVV